MSTARIRLPWNILRKRKGRNGRGIYAVHGLHSPEETALIIERERARSDRTSAGFSLLVVSIASKHQRTAVLMRVAKYLSSRIRLTDELGLVSDFQLCVVLSMTL